MFISNKKSILLAIAIALGCSAVKAQSDRQEVSIDFEAWVGDRKFACGESYENVGTSESTITPTDFRFYVSDVALIDEEGNAVPLELEQDGKWQYQNTALLDFEDGSGVCDNGTTETRSVVTGTVPEGNYESLQFTMGVPQQLNHEDAAIAPSPLNLSSMWWNWQGGYKFLRVEMETEEAISNVSDNSHNNNLVTTDSKTIEEQITAQANEIPSIFKDEEATQGHDDTHTNGHGGDGEHEMDMNHQTSSNAYLIHLGSTGCEDSAQSDLFSCANPNRVEVTLEDFNPEDDVVVADLAELLASSDLATNEANTPAGCMSSPDDSDCTPIMQSLGLTSNAGDREQKFFWIE
jgi:uncharacterized repeat protein (TIGR04052 family)